jgi:hypothetical protein
VPTGAAGCAHAPLDGPQQVVADLAAVGVARLGRLGKAHAGAHEQRLDRALADAEGPRERLVREAVDLAHEQRGALGVGQPADVLHEPAQALGAVRGLEWIMAAGL